MERAVFKECPMCATKWTTRDQFMSDLSVELNGYGADFERIDWSLFYFTHMKEGCFSTMGIAAKDFLDLYSGKKFTERQTGLDGCPEYCLDEKQLDRCSAICECAFNREIIQILKDKKGLQPVENAA